MRTNVNNERYELICIIEAAEWKADVKPIDVNVRNKVD